MAVLEIVQSAKNYLGYQLSSFLRSSTAGHAKIHYS